ncbi:transcriptional regulator [Virgisporangium aliadipatigenens]|uniref:Transcriptional regulator n=1 Tax=Virgisporangium aliadipatigenens TaxID=741659 RepID=A0A8J4DV71_9ACTN|nr:helix-turn-helix transcriptional regulator [Virgisporangium aliadipatigenens]GIJ49857.1 transcriptional regulator [Virgisporangium aliadipatigenens]
MNKKEWLAVPGGVAERLRALHDATGLNGKDFAERLGWHPSKVSRIRAGQIFPSADDVTAWATAAGVPQAKDDLLTLLAAAELLRRDFRQRMAQGQAGVQRDYNRLVADSTVIRYFDTAWIPGFLQTRAYARRVFEEMQELHGGREDIDEAVAVRLERQRYLHDRTKMFDLLIDEPVLHRNVYPAEIMEPQLHYLLTWLDAPNVRVAVLPMRGGHRRMPQNSFQMYDGIVVLDLFHGEVDCDAELYSRVMDDMLEIAATGADARALIRRAVDAVTG